MNRLFCFSISLALLLTLSCVSEGASRQADSQPPSQAVQQQVEQYWTGDGGKDISLGIIVPESQGLTTEQAYLPSMVQGVLVTNMSKYSAISVLDRVSLDKVIEETQDLTYEDSFDIVRLGHVAHVGHMMTGKIMRTSTGYTLQINVTDTTPEARTLASYSGTCTVAELDNQTAIQKASLDLLAQMGVTLTTKAKEELTRAVMDTHINAQTALARGITAQRQGTEVAALSYYFQAAAYDPSLLEAANRSSILNVNISSGNIGDNVRNDIQWRKDWVARLTETEQYFDSFNRTESMPYTLFYSDEIKQGTIDYQKETVTLSIETHLHGSSIWTVSIERALQTVYDGLDATKRKDTWQLGSWPRQGVTNLNAFAKRSGNFSVVFELLNNQSKVISRQTLQTSGSWEFNRGGRPAVNVSADNRKTLSFQNVDANDISDSMTIRIATVNGTDAETAARNGVLQIRASSKSEFDTNDRFQFSKGEIKGFVNSSKRVTNLIIPDSIWGDPVISVGSRSFSGNRLSSVTISNSVISIDDGAFSNNNMTNFKIGSSVRSIGASAFENAFSNDGYIRLNNKIPNSVISIGAKAFFGNEIHSVTIPKNVRYIGEAAFQLGKVSPEFSNGILSSITIGENVAMAGNPFQYSWKRSSDKATATDDGFLVAYNRNNKKAGTYTRGFGLSWKYSPQ
jgi:hypothetical protein